MVITLSGPNDFLIQTALQKHTEEFRQKNGDLSIERFNGEEATYAEIRESLQGMSLFTAAKLVILFSPSKNKEFMNSVEGFLELVPDSTIVIVVEPSIDKRTTFYRLLKTKTQFHEFKQPSTQDLIEWIKNEVKLCNGHISQADILYFLDRVGLNQRKIASELYKLLTYDHNIARENITLLVNPTLQSTVFSLLDASFSGRRDQVLRIYNEQRSLNVEPQMIIALLLWQLHVLAVVSFAQDRSVDQIAQEAKLKSYAIQNARRLVTKVKRTDVVLLVHQLAKLDYDLKTKKIDSDESLLFFLLNISNEKNSVTV